jgi:hypothetical protein
MSTKKRKNVISSDDEDENLEDSPMEDSPAAPSSASGRSSRRNSARRPKKAEDSFEESEVRKNYF